MRLLRWNVVFFLVMLTGAAFAQNASFQSIFRTPTFHTLRKIGYADANTMYAIGDGGTFIRTTDGGATLQRVSVDPAGNESLFYINFMSATLGVVAGDNGLMAITSDGGTSWNTLRLPSKERITAAGFDPVTFLNPLGITGFAATATGKIYTTTNSGSSWLTFDVLPNHPSASFVQTAALGGQTFLAVLANNFVYKTTNDGVTWDSVAAIPLSGITDMFFSDPLHGWVVNTNYWETTTDGGNDWSFGGVWGGSPGSPIAERITSVYFKDNSHGWALGSKPSGSTIYAPMFASTDGGATFGLINKADSNSGIGDGNVYLNAIRFDATGSYGWAVGDAGSVRRSTDGGKTWASLTTGIAEDATPTVSFFDENTGMVCAQNGRGANYTTTDGGATWPRQYGAGENTHTVVMMTSAQNAVSLGNQSASSSNGFITTNGGVNWSSDPVPSGNYTRIYEVDANTLTACGQNGLVIISTNGGAQWKSISVTPDQPALNGIYFSSSTHGFVCGGTGALYSTTDGGTDWTPLSVTGANLNDIAFNSATSGWLASDSAGVVFHTTDGGTSWAPVMINNSVHDTLTRIVFADANNGWIAGSYGQLHQTTDGGATWTSVNTGTSNKFSDMSYAPRTNPSWLWLAGAQGMILKHSLNASGVTEINSTPRGFSLGQNYPNPFSVAGSSTSIPFSISMAAATRLDVFNVLGERIRTLADDNMAQGNYVISWDGRDGAGNLVPEGVYFYRLSSGATQVMRSAIVTK
jgi:photosystem II stability/assembly factor-like uncharacterized protein